MILGKRQQPRSEGWEGIAGWKAPGLPSLTSVKRWRRPQQAARRERAADLFLRPLPRPSAESPQRSGKPPLSGKCICGLGNVKGLDFADGSTEKGLPLGPRRGCWPHGGWGLWVLRPRERSERRAGQPGTTAPRHCGCHLVGHPVRNALRLYSHVTRGFKNLQRKLNFG